MSDERLAQQQSTGTNQPKDAGVTPAPFNLDLDALEREQEVIAKYPWWSEPETPRSDPVKIIVLIQRLREAERVSEARAKALRQYVGHHSSCQVCFEVWADVQDTLTAAEEPSRA